MARALPPGRPGGDVTFSTVAPGAMVGGTAVMTLTTSDEKPDKEP